MNSAICQGLRRLAGACKAACATAGLALLGAVATAGAAGAWAAPSAPGARPQAVRSIEGITEYRLANGLQVLLIPDDAKPTTTVNMTYHVGSRHENYGETGMAHLLEHLLFKGSPRHPQVWAEFTKRGLRANGSTWYDRTNYFASFAANEDNLRWYLAWQADAMVNSFIARSDLDSEMTVVRNEMEMGENDPGRILLEKTVSAMYQWHNYGKSTIGARTDVEQVDVARLQAFYRRYYQPDNATLIISGRFDPAQVLGWVREDFDPIPKPARELPHLYTMDPAQDGERCVTLRRVGGTPLLYAAYHVPAAADPDYAPIEALDLILGDTPSGRLHKALVEKGLAASVFAFSEGLADPGFAVFGAQLAPGQDVDAARQTLLQTIESLAQAPITATELRRAQARWLKDWDDTFADPQRLGVALSESVAQGDWRLFFVLRDRVKALQLAGVQRVADAYLLRANRTLGAYLPTDHPRRAPGPHRVDVEALLQGYQGQAGLASVQAFDTTPQNIDAHTVRFDVAPGLQVALLPKPTRGQTVHAVMQLHFGNGQSLAGWGSTPAMAAALLDRGTHGMSRQDLSDRLDALRSDVSFTPTVGGLRIAITSKRDTLAPTITLVGAMLRDSVFAAPMLDEIKRQALADLAQQRKEPQALVDNALDRHDNPYPRADVRHARSFDEMADDVAQVTPERVRAFHERFYGASHAEFGASGDLDPGPVLKALQDAFGGWASPAPYARVPDPLAAPTPMRVVIPTPDKQNAVLGVRLALPVRDSDADAPALMLANYMLGGGGNSRLWNRIRERGGLSYSVYSHVQWSALDAHSTWQAAAIFAPQNEAKVERALGEEIHRALDQGFDADELAAAQRGLLGFRRLARAQDDLLADALAQNLYLGRTFAQADRLDHALQTASLQAVNAALRKYLQPARFAMAIGGDFREAADGPRAPTSGAAP